MWRRSLARLSVTLLLLSIMRSVPCTQADALSAPEYAVKAAYLYNFAKFTDWPPEAFAAGDNAFTLCLLGAAAFDPVLDTIRGKTVQGRTFVIRQVTTSVPPVGCQLLFIGTLNQALRAQLLMALAAQPVLTVSDTADFTQAGGMIQFLPVGNTIRFEINLEATQQAGLKLSSYLLNLAKIVKSSRPEGKP